MHFLAHSENAAGQPHLLKDHLCSVGALARQFADTANPLLAEPAQWAGLLEAVRKLLNLFVELSSRFLAVSEISARV